MIQINPGWLHASQQSELNISVDLGSSSCRNRDCQDYRWVPTAPGRLAQIKQLYGVDLVGRESHRHLMVSWAVVSEMAWPKVSPK
jgi:hypothetical protein